MIVAYGPDDEIPVDEDIWGTDTLTADDFKQKSKTSVKFRLLMSMLQATPSPYICGEYRHSPHTYIDVPIGIYILVNLRGFSPGVINTLISPYDESRQYPNVARQNKE